MEAFLIGEENGTATTAETAGAALRGEATVDAVMTVVLTTTEEFAGNLAEADIVVSLSF